MICGWKLRVFILPTLWIFLAQIRDGVTSRQRIINRSICCLRGSRVGRSLSAHWMQFLFRQHARVVARRRFTAQTQSRVEVYVFVCIVAVKVLQRFHARIAIASVDVAVHDDRLK